jgi:hypothetical protein
MYNDELTAPKWALNSAVECHLHTVEVIGSNPIAPTMNHPTVVSLAEHWLNRVGRSGCGAPRGIRFSVTYRPVVQLLFPLPAYS